MNEFPLETTAYGFQWGPVLVERLISDLKFGVLVSLKAKHDEIELRITPGGRIKVHKWKER